MKEQTVKAKKLQNYYLNNIYNLDILRGEMFLLTLHYSSLNYPIWTRFKNYNQYFNTNVLPTLL